MTFNPNANWTTKNSAAVKQPIYAVSIDGGTVWYHTHEITGSGANHYKYLIKISGVPKSFDPIRGEASRGGVDFELLNSINIWNFDELYLTKVLIKHGYAGLDWSDYEAFDSNMYIFDVDTNSGQTGWRFKCQDLQGQTDKDIFTGATVGSPDVISARNPITFWLQVMMSTGAGTNWPGSGTNYDVLDADQGLGITYSLIDITECELLRDDFISSWQGAWTFTEAVNAEDFLRDEIYLAFGITPTIKANGKMTLRPFLPALYGYLSVNNMATTLADADMIELPGWSTNYRDVINRIIYNYDWDGSDYTSSQTYNDTTSQGLYGIKALTIESKGITTALDGANLTSVIAGRYFRKFAVLPQKIRIKTKFHRRIIEGGDQLLVNSARIPNIDASNMTWVDRVADVWSVSPNYDDGVIELEIRDNNVGALKYGVIAPNGTPEYGSATTEQKVKYCWVNQGNIL